MTLAPADVLRRCPTFELLSPAELEALGEECRPVAFEPGQIVFEEGSPGASLFVLAEGEVEIVHRNEAVQKVIARLRAPAAFGEMALVDREARSATVRACSPCRALELTAEGFTAFRKRSRDGFTFVVINIARVLSTRLRETSRRLADHL
jgi:CRP/FNR family transcriptional regulator, cyclic AMP receptor protein